MLNADYLLFGLNAVSRAHSLNYFEDGHRGGAIISAVYLCKESPVGDGVPQVLGRLIDKHWTHTDLCAPFPDEDAQPGLRQRILDTLARNTDGLRQAGHNVILPTLALKAFTDVPEAVTESRVEGICRLIESFTVSDVPGSDPVEVPNPVHGQAFAEFVLEEFLECGRRFDGRGQGWTGHLLTYSRALLDLQCMGCLETVQAARAGFEVFIRRIRLGPLESDIPREEHSRKEAKPLQKQYWVEQKGDWNLGHVVKYPYGFYGILGYAQDRALVDRCMTEVYRIF